MLHGHLTLCSVSERTNERIPGELLDKKTEGRKDKRTDPNSQDPVQKLCGRLTTFFVLKYFIHVGV